jgi:outer membrane lipoprotein SlyB
MRTTRLASIAAGAGLAALLSACATDSVSLAPVSYPTAPAYASSSPAYLEYGRVVNIDYFPGGTARSGANVPGAILGAVAGALVGNQIGGGSGRDAATILGGVGGAAIGSQVGRANTVTDPVYRITLQTDQGVMRTYDVPVTGDLRVGDRVRVENGVIYRA